MVQNVSCCRIDLSIRPNHRNHRVIRHYNVVLDISGVESSLPSEFQVRIVFPFSPVYSDITLRVIVRSTWKPSIPHVIAVSFVIVPLANSQVSRVHGCCVVANSKPHSVIKTWHWFLKAKFAVHIGQVLFIGSEHFHTKFICEVWISDCCSG